MDCTYKTNRYSLPLLDIVGFALTRSTFYIAFTFIKDEYNDSYELILQCLAKVYDSLNLPYPSTILIDKEDTLIKAITSIFLDIKGMVCL
jgi:hypothetical protein